jgi:UDP-N-acetylglucosamine acyltransferase
VHRGTVQGNWETRIGSDNLFMPYVHIAHDCVVGNHVILSNNASIAGHVHVGDWAIMAGYALSHQFVHIGAHCFIATGAVLLPRCTRICDCLPVIPPSLARLIVRG